MYLFPEEATKGGYRPLEEEEWSKLIQVAKVVSDKEVPRLGRQRLLYHNQNWYHWLQQADRHECYQINSDPLHYNEWVKMRFVYKDIERSVE